MLMFGQLGERLQEFHVRSCTLCSRVQQSLVSCPGASIRKGSTGLGYNLWVARWQ